MPYLENSSSPALVAAGDACTATCSFFLLVLPKKLRMFACFLLDIVCAGEVHLRLRAYVDGKVTFEFGALR